MALTWPGAGAIMPAHSIARYPVKYVRELLKGNTDSLLLTLISEKPMYGYQIIKELEKRSQGYFQLREGTLYPALHRLERQGYLSSRWERLPGGQERRYYQLTEKGSGNLARMTQEWQGFATAVNLVLRPAPAS